jgi:RNA polymerase sigma-70 factor (ECF subfamily)
MDQTASLLDRLRQPDDQAAWDRFVDLYTPLIFFWAVRAGLQAQDAADLVQEVFLTLLLKLPEFQHDPTRSFRAWLHTLTLNRWRDLKRKKVAVPVGATLPEELAAPPQGAEALWEDEYRRHLVARATEIMQAEFQPQTWQAFWGLAVEGRSGFEVAKELGVSLDVVYAAKARVLRRLRRELGGLLD